MSGKLVTEYRKKQGFTQLELANKLSITQAYLSLIERNRRPLSNTVAQKLVKVLDLPPTILPLQKDVRKLDKRARNQSFVNDLAGLQYPKYSHVRYGKVKNPVSVLAEVLSANNVEGRIVEALPWLLFKFNDLEWDNLIATAKLNNLQNRLGFITCLARRLAERRGDKRKAKLLKKWEDVLEDSRLVKEDTLCREKMNRAEREWLLQSRSEDAMHWNILSNLSADYLDYGK